MYGSDDGHGYGAWNLLLGLACIDLRHGILWLGVEYASAKKLHETEQRQALN